jgi:rhodanese-related sulfurtransferase/DNA-binding transcriptional ArsR family regulator
MYTKDAIYHEFSRVGKALSSAARIEILDLLSQSEKTVEVIAAQTRLSVKNASAHLRVLRHSRLVETRKASPFVYYRIASDDVTRLVHDLRKLAGERLAEVEQITRLYFDEPGALEAIPPDELLRRVSEGAVTLLDVRPRDEYAAAHLPGALSIPPDEVEARLAELPRDVPIIAYCRGPLCVYAIDAVRTLTSHGYRATRMSVGVPEWRLAGHPTQHS